MRYPIKQANSEAIHTAVVRGRAATAVHFGPHARLSEAHAGIRQWCAEHGHQLSDVSWEIYGHWEESWNADPARIRTDVFHLLQDPEG